MPIEGQLTELSLFTGAGGGLLGTKLLNFRAIGYVEYEPYCQKIIQARIEDGILDAAPIFGDIRKFISDGYAASYTGMVDVVTAGFPCQPFSIAGQRKGADDERNMWPATIETIRIVRPRFAFLENVPGLFHSGYFGTVLRDLHETGYDARWCCISAASCGAPCKRERLFALAVANGLYGEKRVGTLTHWPTSLQQGVNPKMFRSMWLQTVESNAGSHNGMANYMESVKAIGNGQVPAVVATAWRILSEGLV